MYRKHGISFRNVVISEMSEKGERYSSGQAANDNHANQCNPNNSEHRGHQPGYTGTGTRADLNNHANQLNPNNPEYKAKK